MTEHTLFYIIIGIIVFDFLLERFLGYLNYTWYSKEIPEELADIYDKEEYEKSQRYKMVNYKFGLLSSTFSFVLLLAFLFLDGFKIVNDIAQSLTDHYILTALVFFGIIGIASEIISLPFSLYQTFIIEERFGFNKTTFKTYIFDKIKGYFLGVLIGGGILALIIWIYFQTQENFWWYVWILIFSFSLLMNMFYSKLVVPLFNKQAPLEEGSLRDKIAVYAKNTGFHLDKIFVIDGSKRSTKANAYFSGFGSEKRVTLYDTLIDKLSEEEIVAVLAHEVGHYRKKHIIYNLIASAVTTGLTLYIFSLVVDSDLLAGALGIKEVSFHIGLVAFGLLYSPISTITGILMNLLSRRFEYQADEFAKETYSHEPLIAALKKLSKTSLSNLTPHPWYVWFHYSHPSLLQRISAMK
ncbi:MAG: M48 family metallopeptidase [Nonlabens sp.]